MTNSYPRVGVEGDDRQPVERKVKAGTLAATLTAGALSLLGLYVFHGVVPDWVAVLVEMAVTGGLTFVAAYRARHTPRAPQLPPPAVSGPGVLPEDEPPLT
ncbi:hypothetical protein [Amycolatopsis eburnea]|uniref:Uncharacterized protein n=1 Tax=Amycolatopsis eburnea TaxID=2267691 RepID=A0A3R9DSH2_9PSEU|nr:hypothetical protein [Amycolatopsis eburnea]RSD26339.1 hypothetical protein EIY87_00300 [Amycolatopsis eburnea]